MKKLHYIASGNSYINFNNKLVVENPEFNQLYSDSFKRITSDTKHHEFGALFNAYVETGVGEKLVQLKHGIDHIHADSGGLQIVTRGLKVDESIKDNIYRSQAKYADLGMCFDEIPIKTLTGISKRNDVNNRWFDNDNFEHFARLTGKNLFRQIQVFQEEKSKCKPILIAQGNDYDTYMQWVEYILDEIPKDLHNQIGGVAMGAAALGTGPLEDIDRAFIFSQLPLEVKHLHILGVGSIRRLLPYLVFIKNGLYGDTTVSYDSTTHTSGVALGLYYENAGKTMNFTRVFNKDYEKIYNEICEFVPDFNRMSVQDFYDGMNINFTTYSETMPEKLHDFFNSRISFTTTSIHNFIKHLERIIDDKEELLANANGFGILQPINHLFDVNNKESYNEWRRHFSQHINSSRVSSTKPSTLEGFFD